MLSILLSYSVQNNDGYDFMLLVSYISLEGHCTLEQWSPVMLFELYDIPIPMMCLLGTITCAVMLISF
ncbi:hypothetical protein ACET3Z_021189 [Daucus carota]